MNTEPDIAIWALTPGGLNIAKKLKQNLKDSHLFLSKTLDDDGPANRFDKLAPAVSEYFSQYTGHVFIMSTGIVVRMIADLIRHKTEDPAVVVVDDTGKFAIPLLSGHIGGANQLALSVAAITGGTPVITTATDANNLPSIDMIAQKNGLLIENPDKIKSVNMAFLKDQQIILTDPYGIMTGEIPEKFLNNSGVKHKGSPKIEISEKIKKSTENTLFLRPRILSVGIGCNRGTPASEIKALLLDVFDTDKLSLLSINNLATIDIKKDETGILDLAAELKLPLQFYESGALNRVESIENPSEYAKKHTGARSVCEAAAILAAKSGKLIVTKKKTRNVTIAVAREKMPSML